LKQADPSSGDAPLLELRSLAHSFAGRPALRGLDLAVGPGEIVGLIGPDGAGKTTAMRIACGLLRPDGGRAEVLGVDVTREARRIKLLLGYMPQRFSLYQDLSVSENLRFFADLYGVTRSQRAERTARLLDFSRLRPFLDRRAEALSGGMKQKLALACTLIHTPRLLVLDEPTTGVDPVSRREFWRILDGLAESGLGLLVSTPYMDEAERCRRVLLMHHGRCLARGEPEEVAAAVPRRLLRLSGLEVDGARRELEARAPAGLEVLRTGDEVRVFHDGGAAETALRELLEPFRVELEEGRPAVEDTFFALVRAADRRREVRAQPGRGEVR